MTDYEIIKHIDGGAVFYIDFFGDAEHMVSTDNGIFRTIRPKDGEQGIKFVYDLRLDSLTDDEAWMKIVEIKSLGLPVWWPLHSKRIIAILHGENYLPSETENDEFYMVLFPENKLPAEIDGFETKRVETKADFKLWADIVNKIFTGGYQDIHPANH